MPQGVGVQVPSSPLTENFETRIKKLKIEVEPREDHQVKVTAEFTQEEFENYFNRAARKASRQTRIPGFRPGKAPIDVVRRIVGDEVIKQQAIEDLVDEQYPKVIDEAKINPGGTGALEEIVSIEPPKLVFVIPLEPEVKLGAYKDLRKEYSLDDISETEIEDYLKRLRMNYSTAEPVERAAEKGDLVYVKFSGKLTQPTEGEDENVFPERPAQFIASDDTIEGKEWPFPGFTDSLVGAKADDVKTITHTYGEDEKDEALRGKEVLFTVVVQSIKSVQLPDMDDDFAKTVGQFETVDDLRNTIKEQLTYSKTEEYENEYFTGLIDQIIADSSIKYPPHLLEHEIEHMIEHLESDLSRQGLEMDTYFKMIGKEKDKFIDEEIRPSAIKRLERSLVIEQIARDEEIKLGEEDYNLAINETMQALQSMPQPKKSKQKIDKDTINSMTMNALNRRMNQIVLNRLKAIGTGEAEKAAEVVAEPDEKETVEATPKKAVKPRKPKAAVETAENVTSEPAPKKAAKPRKPKAAAGETESTES